MQDLCPLRIIRSFETQTSGNKTRANMKRKTTRNLRNESESLK